MALSVSSLTPADNATSVAVDVAYAIEFDATAKKAEPAFVEAGALESAHDASALTLDLSVDLTGMDILDGDLLLIFVFGHSDRTLDTLSTPGGWTLTGSVVGMDAGAWYKASAVYRHVVSGSAPSNPTFTWTVTGAINDEIQMYAVAQVFRGIDPSTPVADTAQSDSGFSVSSAFSAPTADATANNSVAVRFGAIYSTGDSYISSAAEGTDAYIGTDYQDSNGDGDDFSLASSHTLGEASGAVGTMAFSITGDTAHSNRHTVVLNPVPKQVHVHETSDDSLVESIDMADVTVTDDTAEWTLTDDLESEVSYYVLVDSGAFLADSDDTPWGGFSEKTDWDFTTESADAPADGTVSATSVVSAGAQALADGDGSSEASSTVTASGQASANATGSAATSSAVTAVSLSQAESAGSSLAVGTVTASGQALASSAGASPWSATVAGQSSAGIATGSCSASANVSGAGSSALRAAGTVAAGSTVSGTGLSLASTSGLCTSVSSVPGVCTALSESAGVVTWVLSANAVAAQAVIAAQHHVLLEQSAHISELESSEHGSALETASHSSSLD